jgi:hypothetical protein
MRARTDRGRRRRPALAAVCLLLPLGFLLLGCDPVVEDRSINVSPSGNQAAFQHGSDGIFVADPRTGEMRKVFDPDPTILAASSPLWSADESRALFTTARAEPQPVKSANVAGPAVAATAHPSAATPVEWDDAPAGRYFFASPIVYTCWQLERAADGTLKPPVSLFEAHCGHAGYVAGNWAVRRHPREEKIVFIDCEPGGGHAVWSFDVKTRDKSRVFPPEGVAAPGYVLCDYSPDGSRIVCTAGRALRGPTVTVGPHRDLEFDLEVPPPAFHQLDGIWIQAADGATWRHIAQSTASEAFEHEGLAALIGRRPTFSADGSVFAFVRPAGDAASPEALLFRGRTSEHKVEQIFKTQGAIVDPHWSGDGARLGFVEVKTDRAELTLIDAHGKAEHPAPHDFVRGFAGWNSAGDELAYVVAEHAPPRLVAAPGQVPAPANGQDGSPLLWPDPLARDALVVSKGGVSRVLIAGLRLTFPQWSPGHETIAVWGTFTPSYESWANRAVGRGLGVRAGDPAAVIDVTSGSVRWLAINGDEQAQVGHYLQLKRDFSGALEWYRRAEKTLPKLEPLDPSEFGQGVAGHTARRRTFEFLLWHCLAKLGNDREAAEHLTAFEQAYHLQWPAAPASAPAGAGKPATTAAAATPAPLPPEAREEAECLASVLRAFAEAQALLSVDDVAGATDFFNHKLDAARGKDPVDSAQRLADALALSQLDLLSRNFGRYLQRATNDVGPLVVTMLEDRQQTSSTDTADLVRFALADGVGRGSGPLFQPRSALLSGVPPDQVAQAAARWRSLRPQCRSDSARLIVDLVLRGLLPAGEDQQRGELNVRIARNPALSWFQWNVQPLE